MMIKKYSQLLNLIGTFSMTQILSKLMEPFSCTNLKTSFGFLPKIDRFSIFSTTARAYMQTQNTGFLKKNGAKVRIKLFAYSELQNHEKRIKLFFILTSFNSHYKTDLYTLEMLNVRSITI